MWLRRRKVVTDPKVWPPTKKGVLIPIMLKFLKKGLYLCLFFFLNANDMEINRVMKKEGIYSALLNLTL